MPLTEEEKKELEMLDNPSVEFLSSSVGGIFSSLFTSANTGNRKSRVVELKIKIRMEESGFGEKKDWQKYYEIQREEEKKFDDKFKK